MGKYEKVSTFGLAARFISLVKRFASQEKLYVKGAVEGTMKTSLPGAVLACAGVVFLLISGVYALVSLVLILNIWFVPWASALIATAFFMLAGLVLGLIGLIIIKKGLGKARVNLEQVKEDMRWLKKS